MWVSFKSIQSYSIQFNSNLFIHSLAHTLTLSTAYSLNKTDRKKNKKRTGDREKLDVLSVKSNDGNGE